MNGDLIKDGVRILRKAAKALPTKEHHSVLPKMISPRAVCLSEGNVDDETLVDIGGFNNHVLQQALSCPYRPASMCRDVDPYGDTPFAKPNFSEVIPVRIPGVASVRVLHERGDRVERASVAYAVGVTVDGITLYVVQQAVKFKDTIVSIDVFPSCWRPIFAKEDKLSLIQSFIDMLHKCGFACDANVSDAVKACVVTETYFSEGVLAHPDTIHVEFGEDAPSFVGLHPSLRPNEVVVIGEGIIIETPVVSPIKRVDETTEPEGDEMELVSLTEPEAPRRGAKVSPFAEALALGLINKVLTTEPRVMSHPLWPTFVSTVTCRGITKRAGAMLREIADETQNPYLDTFCREHSAYWHWT